MTPTRRFFWSLVGVLTLTTALWATHCTQRLAQPPGRLARIVPPPSALRDVCPVEWRTRPWEHDLADTEAPRNLAAVAGPWFGDHPHGDPRLFRAITSVVYSSAGDPTAIVLLALEYKDVGNATAAYSILRRRYANRVGAVVDGEGSVVIVGSVSPSAPPACAGALARLLRSALAVRSADSV